MLQMSLSTEGALQRPKSHSATFIYAMRSPVTDQKIVITFIPVCDWKYPRVLKYVRHTC